MIALTWVMLWAACVSAVEPLYLNPNVRQGVFTAEDGREICFYREGGMLGGSTADYEWWYGCSPTSAGMMMGFYDLNGYDPGTGHLNYYDLVPGGDAETETHSGPPTGWSALVNNVIASADHVADFYIDGYLEEGDDREPPPPHHDPDCLADFMGTSQDSAGNVNGSTTFYYFTDNSPLTAAYAAGRPWKDESGMLGIGEYVEYAGYDYQTLYNQRIYGYDGISEGFTIAQYQAEIDAGRPVLIHIEGHTMCGVGYDDADPDTIYVYDTWSAGSHAMTWGGSYSGRAHTGVTVVEVAGGIADPPIAGEVLEVTFRWGTETGTLVLTYGEDGATSARDDPDGLDVVTGWGDDKFAATSEGDVGIYSRSVPFCSGGDMLLEDARAVDDTGNVLIETYTNKVYPWPDTWVPGETWNEGGTLEFSVISDDKDFFDGFSLLQKLPGRFLDGTDLVDVLLGDILDASGEGSVLFDRVGCAWIPGFEVDWWIGPFASFDLIPPGGTPWTGSPDSPLVVESGAHAVFHIPTPEPSSLTLLAMAVAGLCVFGTRRRWSR